MADENLLPVQATSSPIVAQANAAQLTLESLEFSGGESIKIEPNAIVVIVGPNNAGKSRALIGIHQSAQNKSVQQVCKGIFSRRGSVADLKTRLQPFRHLNPAESSYVGPEFGTSEYRINQWEQAHVDLDDLAGYFCVLLDTASRLGRCGPGPAHVVGQDKPTPRSSCFMRILTLKAK